MYIEVGRELDNIGAQCGINRQQGEGDATYRARIIATGGSAFGEFKQAGELSVKTGGVTVRDYFAAKALQGMLAYPGDEQRGSHHNNNDAEGVAQMSYAYADAMLAERSK